MVTAIVFTLCVVAALGLFVYQLWGRFNVLRAAAPAERFDRIAERIQAVLVYAFGQKKFVRPEAAIVSEQTAGWMHFFIFWGFTILGLQVVTMFGRAYSDHFYVPLFTPGPARRSVPAAKDIDGGARLRWRSPSRWCAGCITHPARLYGYEPAERPLRRAVALGGVSDPLLHRHDHDRRARSTTAAAWSSTASDPSVAGRGRVGAVVARSSGRSRFACSVPRRRSTLGNVAWWVHNLVILVFLNLLPLSKHFHIITSLPNVFFKQARADRRAVASRTSRTPRRFGTSHINQFTWKQVLDMYSCTECGRCSSHCPATATGKPLAPRQLLLDLRDYLYEHQDEVIEKRVGASGQRRRRRAARGRREHRRRRSSTTTCSGPATSAAPARRRAR